MNIHELRNKTMIELDHKLQEMLESEKALPDVVYHYTDASGLEGILKSRSMWATHALHLNDPQEIKYGWRLFEKILRDCLRAASGEKARFLDTCLQNLPSVFEFERSLPASYFISLSANSDDLSQYRAYSDSGAGYCMGLNTGTLMGNLSFIQYAGGSLFEILPVVYDIETQRVSFDLILTDCWNLLEQVPNKQPLFHSISLECIHAAMSLACRFKRPAFAPENEWRVVPSPFGGSHAIPVDPYIRTRVRSGYFVPFLELPITQGDDSTLAVVEIFIGPKLNHELAEIGLTKFLNVSANIDCEYWPEIKPSQFDLQ